jgi:hypothetical protein
LARIREVVVELRDRAERTMHEPHFIDQYGDMRYRIGGILAL